MKLCLREAGKQSGLQAYALRSFAQDAISEKTWEFKRLISIKSTLSPVRSEQTAKFLSRISHLHDHLSLLKTKSKHQNAIHNHAHLAQQFCSSCPSSHWFSSGEEKCHLRLSDTCEGPSKLSGITELRPGHHTLQPPYSIQPGCSGSSFNSIPNPSRSCLRREIQRGHFLSGQEDVATHQTV